jgi:alpha/beta superfamily hydrolase
MIVACTLPVPARSATKNPAKLINFRTIGKSVGFFDLDAGKTKAA